MRVVTARVSSEQHGFVKGKRETEAVLAIESALLTAYECGHSDFPSGVFLDQAAAFASVAHSWISLALATIGVPDWLLIGVLALYDNSAGIIGVGDSSIRIAMKAGIRQGCPASGSVWALIFDCVVRGLVRLLAPRRGLVRAYADDLALVLMNVLTDFPTVLKFFDIVLLACGLALNLKKTQVLNLSRKSNEQMARLLAFLGASQVQVRHWAKYLGVLLGPGAAFLQFEDVGTKFRKRVSHVGTLGLPQCSSVVAYHIFCLSILRHKMQIAPLDKYIRSLEAPAIARILSAPMHAFPKLVAGNFADITGSKSVQLFDIVAWASSARVALGSAELDRHEERSRVYMDSDDVLLVPRTPAWTGSCTQHLLDTRLRILPLRPALSGVSPRGLQHHILQALLRREDGNM